MLLFIGYFVSFWGVLQSYTHRSSSGVLFKIKGSYTQLNKEITMTKNFYAQTEESKKKFAKRKKEDEEAALKEAIKKLLKKKNK